MTQRVYAALANRNHIMARENIIIANEQPNNHPHYKYYSQRVRHYMQRRDTYYKKFNDLPESGMTSASGTTWYNTMPNSSYTR